MTARLFVLALAASGCFVVPKRTSTQRDVGLIESPPRFGVVRGLSLSTDRSLGHVIVKATRHRDCIRDVLRITEITERKHLGLGGVEDPRGRAFGFILAPVTLPISLLVSGLAVASSGPRTRRTHAPEGTKTYACTQPAENVQIHVTLASGATLERRTNREGKIAFRIPETEPDQGTLIVRAETQVLEKKYRRKARVDAAQLEQPPRLGL